MGLGTPTASVLLASEGRSAIEEIIEWVGVGFDVAGVGAIVIGAVIATVRFVRHYFSLEHDGYPYRRFKIDLGLSLLLGLEILVAADIIKTVALTPDFESLGVLGLLVVIRTFLSWALVLEIEGRFPWSAPRNSEDGGTSASSATLDSPAVPGR